jgi:hypothetical protein
MSGKRYLCVKNFDEQQHYKDRNPIWIKMHCSLLDDYEFANIADEAKFHAVGLMLLASRLNNKFPDDERWLRRKINANSEINIKLLLEIGFLDVVKDKKASEKTATMPRKSKKTQGKSASAISETVLAQNRTEENRTEENKTEHNTTDETRELAALDAAENGVVVCVDFKSSQTGAGNREKTKAVGQNNAEVLPDARQNARPQTPEIEAATSAGINAEDNAETNPEINFDGGKNRISADGHLSAFSLEDCLRYVHLCEMKGDAIKNPQGLAHHLFKTGASDVFIRHALFPEQQAAIEREQYGAPVRFTDQPCRVCFGAKMADAGGKGFRKCAHCRDERGKSTGFEPEGEKGDEAVF